MDTKKKILAVDDEPDVATIIKGILTSEEYDVQSLCSGKLALAWLKEEKADLIILDIKMPEVDGFEVLKRLRAASETASIPVILLTGKGQYQDVLKGYELGADYYMNKPFTSAQLINGVRLFLNERSTQRSVSEAAG